MKPGFKKLLSRICRHHRRSIWINRITRYIPVALWCCTGLLFSAALVYQLILPFQPLPLVYLTLTAFIIYTGWITLREKPSEDEAAASVDRLCHANSLFISAWELSRVSNLQNDMAELLFKRAEKEINVWSVLVRQQPEKKMKASSMLAITLCALSLWLLLQTTHIPDPVNKLIAVNHPPRQHQQNDSGTKLSAVISKTAHSPAQNYNQYSIKKPDSSFNVTETSAVLHKENRIHNNDDFAQEKSLENRPSFPPGRVTGIKSSMTTNNKTPGDSLADQKAGDESTDHSDKQLLNFEPFTKIDLINIETGSDVDTIAYDQSGKGQKLLISIPELTSNEQLSTKNTSILPYTSDHTLLSAEQRFLISRYFKQLDN